MMMMMMMETVKGKSAFFSNCHFSEPEAVPGALVAAIFFYLCKPYLFWAYLYCSNHSSGAGKLEGQARSIKLEQFRQGTTANYQVWQIKLQLYKRG